MEFLTLKSFFGEHLTSVIFTGGTSIFLLCKSEGFPFYRRTNDIDIFVADGSPDRKKIKLHLRAIPHAEYERGSETDIAQYITIGRYHIDLLKDSLRLLPTEKIIIDDIAINITSRAEIAGKKIARLTHHNWAKSMPTVIHDLLDTAILHEMALKKPESYDKFIQETCLVFATRIGPYKVPFEEALSLISDMSNQREKIKESLIVKDPESPLFGLDEKSFDNITNAFLKFTKQISKELEGRKADYAEFPDILYCPVTPAHLKHIYIEKHLLKSGLITDETEAKEYAQRCKKSPVISTVISHTPSF